MNDEKYDREDAEPEMRGICQEEKERLKELIEWLVTGERPAQDEDSEGSYIESEKDKDGQKNDNG